MKLTKLSLDKENRMLRLGFGKHNSKWFIRIDLWFIGFRLAQKETIEIKPKEVKTVLENNNFKDDDTLATVIKKRHRILMQNIIMYLEINLRANNIDKLNKEILELKLCDLTPAQMMCILRSTYRFKENSEWELFRNNVVTELTTRKFNYISLLVGLL